MSATPQAITFARHLRKSMTRSEVALWNALRGKKLGGLRFRRQHPLGPYVLDFYCAQHRLAVEVDGAVHAAAKSLERDAERDQWIERCGVHIVRIPGSVVLSDMDAALRRISDAARTRARE
ncbi:MAG: endonuclease domain-containing protein [Caulobacter sp.]|nr:endonuclease domain-containing protein [Caulobacter sp.]